MTCSDDSTDKPAPPLEGAFASDLKQLLQNQRSAARRIIRDVHELARREAQHRAQFSSDDDYAWEQWGRRPQQVFFIDGARGAGKTYVLMSILNFVRQLGRGGMIVSHKPLGNVQQQTIKRTVESLRAEQKSLNEKRTKDQTQIDLFSLPRYERTAIVLPTIFPVDAEDAGTSMDVIFAAIDRRLERRIERGTPAHADKFRDLRKELLEVTRCWTFSKNLGTEAILSDSIDYESFVRKRAAQAWESNLRIDRWRDFINAFLDAFNAAQLVIGIDDTDVRPELTVDILHTIRMYLDHPRIVTILAGNLRAMRQSLVYAHFSRIEKAANAIGDNNRTLEDWRRYERDEIEQYLEKVLPRWRRNFIGSSDPRTAPGGFESEMRAFFNDKGMDDLCRRMLANLRKTYVIGKAMTALQYQEVRHDRWIRSGAPASAVTRRRDRVKNDIGDEPKIRAGMENFVSWWLLRHSYADKLRPSTARQALVLRNYLEPYLQNKDGSANDAPTTGMRRLSVMIFENADNFLLTQRFDDTDKVITEWLCKQKVTSSWSGQRWIEINGRRLPEGSYSYEAICFRVDLVFARPLRFHEDGHIPSGLLPRPAGVRTIAPFYGSSELSDVPYFGVSALLDHAAIPRNCIFLTDLRVLPGASFYSRSNPPLAKNPGEIWWESKAARDILTLFGNDPRSGAMVYLRSRVAPILGIPEPQLPATSWASDYSEPLLEQELRSWMKREKVEGAPTIARYLSLFTALRSAWAATVVFTNALEHSINHGLDSDNPEHRAANGESAGHDDDLIIRGTLSQDVSRNRYMFLDFARLNEAVGVVRWLRTTLDASAWSPKMHNEIVKLIGRTKGHMPLPLDVVDFGTIAKHWNQPLFEACETPGPQENRKARSARLFLLYIVGLHASLPALIHVEFASYLGIGEESPLADRKPPPGALKKLQKARKRWSNFIVGAYAFLARAELDAMRIMLNTVARVEPDRFKTINAAKEKIDPDSKHRHDKAKSDDPVSWMFEYPAWQFLCRELPDGKPFPGTLPQFTFAPDICASTLFGDPHDDQEHSHERTPGYSAGSVGFCGLFEQARTNLWLGFDYLKKTYSKFEDLAAGNVVS